MPATIESFRIPHYREIPDVGLYLDQTVKYINRYLTPLGCAEITPSMVSNYVKKGYIKSPVHKQYDPEQIAYLFAISILKNVLPIENIAKLFVMQRRIYDTEKAYDYFCMELENMFAYTYGLKGEMDEVGTSNTELKRMLRSVIIAVAQISYVNHRFEELAQEEGRLGASQKAD